jgi:hypothetical protein
MAFRLRRGLKSELDNLPLLAQGELIFTTDEGKLYVGTGGPGANAIDVVGTGSGASTLAALTDTNIVDPSPGDVLSWDSGTNKWVAAVPGAGSLGLDDLTDVFLFRAARANDALIYDGYSWTTKPITDYFCEQQNYKINIVGDDSTIIINTDNNRVTGNFFGNLQGNVTGRLIGDVEGSVFADDSTLLVDGVSGVLRGRHIGTLTGNVTGNTTGLHTGNVTGNTTGVHTGNVIGNVTGLHTGNVIGDIEGSIFGDDSTLIVDAINHRLYGDLYSGSTLLVDSFTKEVYANVDNAITTSETINGGTLQLSGVNNIGLKAGIKIITDGGADDGYSLFDVSARNPGVTGQAFIFERGRGTPAIPSKILNGDEIMSLIWLGLDHNVVPQVTAAMRISVSGTTGPGIVPGKIELATANAAGVMTSGLTIDSDQVIDVASNTVAANSGSGTADVTSGVVSYLKIKIAGVVRAIPVYGIVP